MKWLELTVYTTDAGTEAVCAALNGAGIMGLSIEESREKAFAFLREAAIFWDFADMDKIGTDTPCVKGYVADCPENLPVVEAAKAAVARLRTLDLPYDIGTLSMSVVSLDEEDWVNNWKQYYKPLPIGKRLLVLPSWEERPDTDRIVLKLDPGMAFGTGAHQTTRMCLEFLEKTVRPGDTMLDLGCGSGILSIAARLLGAVQATAVDIDPIAESIAYENAEMNGIGRDGYRVLIGNVLDDLRIQREISGQYPVVAANIVADVIIALAPLARTLVQPGGVFLVSGIIDERVDEVVQALNNSGFAIAEHSRAEGWNAFLCR
jgi:ribosomal protein L11 methyltransferase